jgi:hypothetical protein
VHERTEVEQTASFREQEDGMPAKPHVVVEPRPGGRWAVQKNGTQRASKLFDRKQDAVERARKQAQREGSELVIKRADGTIEKRDSHGRDPRRSKG